MTKIAYIRATAHKNNNLSVIPTSPVKPAMMLQPPIISASSSRPQFIPNNNLQHHIQKHPPPKPMIMTPTTRFNTNPNVLIFDQQNGGRISKPLMEKRRRARINQCLSQLKTIVVDSAGQYTQNNKCKLEKADILELTVNYVKKLHNNQQQQQDFQINTNQQHEQYLAGYTECVRQVCEYLNTMKTIISEQHQQSIQDYLQRCLMVLQQQPHPQSSNETPPIFTHITPPSPAPSSESNKSTETNNNSPDMSSPQSMISVQSQSTAQESTDNVITKISDPKRRKRTIAQASSSASDSDDYYDEDYEEMDEEEDDYFEFSTNTNNYPLNLKITTNHHHPNHQMAPMDATNMLDDDVWRPW